MATVIVWKQMFDTHIAGSDKIVLVDFWAERCGPCRMLKPVLHDIAEARDDVELLTVDVDNDENGDLSMQFSVRSIPQVTIFKGGEAVDQFIWALPPEQIEALIDKHSSSSAEQEEESEQQEEETE